MNAIASHVEEQITVNRGHMVEWDLLWQTPNPFNSLSATWSGISTANVLQNELENCTLKIAATSTRDQWVKSPDTFPWPTDIIKVADEILVTNHGTSRVNKVYSV